MSFSGDEELHALTVTLKAPKLHKIVPKASAALFGSSKERRDNKDDLYWDFYVGSDGEKIHTAAKHACINVVEHFPRRRYSRGSSMLRGRIYSPKNTKESVGVLVITMSGSCGSSVQFMTDIAYFYVQHGCHVLALDYRGFGASTQVKTKDLHTSMLLEDAIEFYRCGLLTITNHEGKYFRPCDIILHGYSMGAGVAAYVARKVAVEYNAKIRGVVVDRAMTKVKQAAKAHGSSGWQGNIAKSGSGDLNCYHFISELYEVFPDIPILTTQAGDKDPLSKGDLELALHANKLGFPNHYHLACSNWVSHESHAILLKEGRDVFSSLIKGISLKPWSPPDVNGVSTEHGLGSRAKRSREHVKSKSESNEPPNRGREARSPRSSAQYGAGPEPPAFRKGAPKKNLAQSEKVMIADRRVRFRQKEVLETVSQEEESRTSTFVDRRVKFAPFRPGLSVRLDYNGVTTEFGISDPKKAHIASELLKQVFKLADIDD